MSTAAKLTAEQVENLAKEIREFLLEHGLWQDVDIYFNGKKYTSYDPENGKYYYNDREHLIEVADQPERHFEYVNPEHILSMSFEGPVLKESVIRVQSQLNDWMDCVFVVSKDDEEKAREVLEKAWDSFWEDGDGWCYGNYLEDKLVNAGIAFDAYYADAEE